MHPDRMRLAAEHLRLNAQCLFEYCTVCEEMVSLADELERAAGCLPNPVADVAPASGAHVQRVVGQTESQETKP